MASSKQRWSIEALGWRFESQGLWFRVEGRLEGKTSIGPYGLPAVGSNRLSTNGLFTNSLGGLMCGSFIRCCAALQERCPLRQKSRVERLKAKVEPLLI